MKQPRKQFKYLGGSPVGRLLAVSIPSVLTTVAAVSGAQAPTAVPSNVPYALPVQLPATVQSPPVAASAPYTPAILSLIGQLEPDNPPTFAELVNADNFLHDWAPVGRGIFDKFSIMRAKARELWLLLCNQWSPNSV